MAQPLIVPTAPKLESQKDSEEVRKSLLDLASKINEAILGTGREISNEALTSDQKAALAGTDGTPSALNPYVTKSAADKAITAWTAYTPTLTGFETATNIFFQWRKVGENLEITGRFTAGTTTATEARISIPGTYTTMSNVPTLQHNGFLLSSTRYEIYVALTEASKNYICVGKSGNTGPLAKVLASSFPSGSTITVNASFPCAQFTPWGYV